MRSTDIAEALGTPSGAKSVPIALFVPAVDRANQPVDQQFWTHEALTVLGKLYGGATALPAGKGAWWDTDAGHLLHESTVVIFCLAADEHIDDMSLMREFGAFLRRLGRETNQGAVGVVVDSDYHQICNFDEE
ncbi:hypothetical protein [Mycobacteroides abscessus]|uniref:hypothetical protein n=1 Tax=Mycobacteroides abscessus TaxID=36809 RepID=UPI000318DEA0|nr:hypothetical protein [Mycobacteroides abscessus]